MSLLSRVADRVLHLPPARTRKIDVEKNLPVPMADGTVLEADRYWGSGRSGDPVVLLRSPYGRGSFVAVVARAYAERGLQAVVVSCRGTFGSGGDWLPMRDEAPDGLDTFRWVTGQPWYAGSMTLAGPSYLGYTQWALAAQVPDSIAAMVPHITSSRLTLPFIRPDALDWDLLVRWNFLLEHQESRSGALRSMLKLDEKPLQQAMSRMPKASVDEELAGHHWQFFQDCLRHDSDDPHWKDTDHSDSPGRISTPASYVGGWYDIFLQDQLRDHAATVAGGAPHRLTIGPWTHGSTPGIGAAVAEGIYFALPYANGAEPLGRAPVRLYVMGTGHKGSAAPGIAMAAPKPWRDFDSWPPAGYPTTRLHLAAGGGLTLDPPVKPAAAQYSTYRYDPADPTPSFGGPFLAQGAGPADNRPLESRADVLTFTTPELTDDVEVIGEVGAEIWFSSSLRFADVFVRLCDVDPKGRSVNLCDGIVGVVRSLTPGASMEPGVELVRVSLWPTANVFRRGHRIRVQVSSGSHPRYARNPGTGEPRPTAAKLLAADQRVFHDGARPSAILLPVAAQHLSRLR